jgi:uncharacterized membrane protein
MKLNYKFLLIFAVCLIYVALRFWHLTDSCLWFDEIFSIQAAEMGWREMFWFVAQDLIHPPLFYVFLKIWISIGGESLFWLRVFPVFFSSIALIPFYFLCRQLKLSTTSFIIAFLLIAVNGNLIKYAQEVRMYCVLLCLSLFSLWLFARYLNAGKGIWVLTIVNILLVHTQYFGWFLVVSEVAVLLYLQRVKIGQMMIMFGLTVASIIPWAIAVFQASQINSDVSQNLSWASKPGFLSIVRFLFNLNEPFYFQVSSNDAISIWQVGLPLLLIIFSAIGFYFVDWKTRDESEKSSTVFLAIIVFVPILFAFTASWILPFSIWGTRHLIIVFAPSSILLAKIIDGVQIKTLRVGLISASLVVFCGAFFLELNRKAPQPIWCAWENFANSLSESTRHIQNDSNIAVYTFEDLVAYHFWFALRDSDRGFRVYKVSGVDELAENKAYFLPRGFDGVKIVSFEEITEGKFFVAFRSERQDQEFELTKPPLKNLIEKGYKIGATKTFESNGFKAFLVEVSR